MGAFRSTFTVEGIDKFSIPFKSISAQASIARDSFKETKDSLNALQKKTAKIDSYKKHIEKAKDLRSEMDKNAISLKRLRDKMAETDSPSENLIINLDRVERRSKRLNDQMGKQEIKIGEVTGSLSKLGIEVKDLDRHTGSLQNEEKRLTKTLKDQTPVVNALAKANRALDAARRKRDRSQQGAANLSIVGSSAQQQGSQALRTVAVPISTAIDFEASMSAIGAKVEGAKKGSDAFTRMEDIALSLGSKTSFSASEVAKSIELLGMSGEKAASITEKSVSDLLSIAKAGSLGLEEATGLSVTVIQGFGLDMKKDLGDVADILAYTANSANTNMSEMMEVFKAVGPVAKSAGINLQTVSSMIGTLANVGVKASVAGTAVKNTILNLASPAAAGAKALNKLRIETKTIDGDMRPLVDIFSELALKTKEMGKAEKVAIFEKIGGREAISGFTALIEKASTEKGRKELGKLNVSMKDIEGTAKKMGDALSDNAKGKLTELSAAWEGLSIAAGRVVLPVFTEFVELLTSVTQGMTSFALANPWTTKMIIGTAAAIGSLLLVGGALLSFLGTAKMGIAAMGFAFDVMKIKGLLSFKALKIGLASTGIGLVIVGLGIAIALLIEHWDSIMESIKSGIKWIADFWPFGDDEKMTANVEQKVLPPPKSFITGQKNPGLSSSRTTTVSAPISINIEGNGDPEEIGSKVREEMGRVMREEERRNRGRKVDL
jgi:TP901 family phage tail tape measure protein